MLQHVWIIPALMALSFVLILAIGKRTPGKGHFIGIGFVIPLVTLFCMALSAYTARRIGAPVWDHVGKHTVTAKPLAAWKVTSLILLFFGAIQLQFGVISPVMMKMVMQELKAEKDKPLREFLEKNPPWSLPRRD